MKVGVITDTHFGVRNDSTYMHQTQQKFLDQVFFPTLDLRILRVLRLLRILKLSKYNSALQDLFSAVYSERRAFGSAAFLLLIATVVSASLMHFAEGHA